MKKQPDREPSYLDLDAEVMRRVGYRVIDDVVEHLSGMDREPAWSMMSRQYGEAVLREPVPEAGSPLPELVETLRTEVLAHAGRIGHPRFLAFVPSAVTFAGVMGELLRAAYNPFVGTWVGGSGPAMLELVVLDWLRTVLGLPPGTGGILTSGGSAATLMAVVAAREKLLPSERGEAVIYASDQTHACVERAVWIAGFSRRATRLLPSDRDFRLDPDTVRAEIAVDRARGRIPFLLVGNAGTTNTGSVDPLEELADLAAEEKLWFHVDAAYGGLAAVTARGKMALDGIERADSWAVDPHKWLYQGYECGSVLLREPELLRSAFRIMPEYMQDTDLTTEEPNLADYGLQLTRAARSLGLWLCLKHHGLSSIRRAVDRTLDLAGEAEAALTDDRRFELLSPARLGVVCFRLTRPGLTEPELEHYNRTALHRLNQSGYAFISSTRLGKRFALRFCVLSHRTTRSDVLGVIRRLGEIGAGLEIEGTSPA